MKRSIEFRVWDSQFCKYVCSDDIHICAASGRAKGKLGGNGYVESFHLEQFTGLIDCDGVEIFGGDIVEYHPYHNCGHIQEKRVGEVRYGKTCDYDGFLNCKHYEYVVNGNSLADIADSDYKESAYCKVIGNIHQNPELLEVK